MKYFIAASLIFCGLFARRAGAVTFTPQGKENEKGIYWPSTCGPIPERYAFQISATDIAAAIQTTVHALRSAGAKRAPADCELYARQRELIDPRDQMIQMNVSLPRDNVDRFLGELRKVGNVELAIHGFPHGLSGVQERLDMAEGQAYILLHGRHSLPPTGIQESGTAAGSDSFGYETIRARLRAGDNSERLSAVAQLKQLVEATRNSSSEGGVGAMVLVTGQGAMVQTVSAGMGAEKAGIKQRDIILEIDGRPIDGLPAHEVMKKLRGPPGSSVDLTVRTPGFTKERRVRVTRSILIASVQDILKDARECKEDTNPPVSIPCLGIVAALAPQDEADGAVDQLLAFLDGKDALASAYAIEALRFAFERSVSRFSRTMASNGAPNHPDSFEQNPCAGRENCTRWPDTACYFSEGSSFGGIREVSVQSRRFGIERAVFECRFPGEPKVHFGPFCSLKPDMYTVRITGCNGLTRESTLAVYSGTWAVSVCAEVDGRQRCEHGPRIADSSTLLKASSEHRVEIVFKPEAVARISKADLCSDIIWPDQPGCTWKDERTLMYRQTSVPARGRQFTFTSRGKFANTIEDIRVVAKPSFDKEITLDKLDLPPGRTMVVRIHIPSAGQLYPKASADGVVSVESPTAGLAIDSQTLAGQALAAATRQAFAGRGNIYRIHVDSGSFVFTRAINLNFSLAASEPMEGLGIYRFDGGNWSKDDLSNEKAEFNGLSRRMSISAKTRKSGLYGIFSSIKDSASPETEVVFNGSSKRLEGDMWVVSTDTLVSLNGRDLGLSGLATSYYSLDADSGRSRGVQIFKEPFPASLGPHLLEYYSVDWSGNKEATKRLKFTVTAAAYVTDKAARHIEARLLVGFLGDAGRIETASAAENDLTLLVSDAAGRDALAVSNIGSIGVGRSPSLDAGLAISASDSGVALMLRNGTAIGKSREAIGFVSTPSREMRHSIASEHGPLEAHNALRFSIYDPLAGGGISKNVLSLGALNGRGAVEICGRHRFEAELVVSDGISKAKGSIRRLEAQVPAGRQAAAEETEQQRKAYADIMSMPHLQYGPDDGAPLRAGAVPPSIMAPQGIVRLDSRISNLELALKKSLKRLDELESRLARVRQAK